MTNSQRLSAVRKRLVQWLAENQAAAENSSSGDAEPAGRILSESYLIRDEFYCGRRFDLGTHRAVWFLEENQLKIYAKTGELVSVLDAGEFCEESAEPQGNILSLPSAPSEEIRRAA